MNYERSQSSQSPAPGNTQTERIGVLSESHHEALKVLYAHLGVLLDENRAIEENRHGTLETGRRIARMPTRLTTVQKQMADVFADFPKIHPGVVS